MMGEKRFSFGAVSPNIATIKENGNPLDIGEIVDILNNQDRKIRQLEEEKIELMEDNACQYREMQKLESENEELMIRAFLFEKGINIFLKKEEQMKLYDYVDLEMKREMSKL